MESYELAAKMQLSAPALFNLKEESAATQKLYGLDDQVTQDFGKRCLLAGQSGIVGHITVCDDVVVSGKAVISKDITEPGVYAGTFTAEPVREWNRKVARFRRLGQLIERVNKLEKTDK